MANRQKPESNSPIVKRLEQARQEGDYGEIMAIRRALYIINNPL